MLLFTFIKVSEYIYTYILSQLSRLKIKSLKTCYDKIKTWHGANISCILKIIIGDACGEQNTHFRDRVSPKNSCLNKSACQLLTQSFQSHLTIYLTAILTPLSWACIINEPWTQSKEKCICRSVIKWLALHRRSCATVKSESGSMFFWLLSRTQLLCPMVELQDLSGL